MMNNVCCSQVKNVSQDVIQGKVGKIYVPDQQVEKNRTSIFLSCQTLFLIFKMFTDFSNFFMGHVLSLVGMQLYPSQTSFSVIFFLESILMTFGCI